MLALGSFGLLVNNDIGDFSAGDVHPPYIRRILQEGGNLFVHRFPTGLQIIEFQFARSGPHNRGGGGMNGIIKIANSIHRAPGIGDAIEYGCFKLDFDIVAGNDRNCKFGQLAL